MNAFLSSLTALQCNLRARQFLSIISDFFRNRGTHHNLNYFRYAHNVGNKYRTAAYRFAEANFLLAYHS